VHSEELAGHDVIIYLTKIQVYFEGLAGHNSIIC